MPNGKRSTKLPKVSRRRIGSPKRHKWIRLFSHSEAHAIVNHPDCHPNWTECPTCKNDIVKCVILNKQGQP
jgi:hypothetical protein